MPLIEQLRMGCEIVNQDGINQQYELAKNGFSFVSPLILPQSLASMLDIEIGFAKPLIVLGKISGVHKLFSIRSEPSNNMNNRYTIEVHKPSHFCYIIQTEGRTIHHSGIVDPDDYFMLENIKVLCWLGVHLNY